MGSPPKQQAPTKPAPPVRQSAEDIAFEKEEQRRKQALRNGYAKTLEPKRTALTGAMPSALPKKTALG